MMASDSESMDNFDQESNKGGLFAQVSQTIESKIKTVMKSVTGAGIFFDDNKKPSVEEQRKKSNLVQAESNDMTKNEPRSTIMSSNISQTAAVVAQDYLTEVYSNALKSAVDQKAEYTLPPFANEIQFVREVTEESIRNEIVDIPNMAKDYLFDIFNKFEGDLKHSLMTEESFDLSEGQHRAIGDYVQNLYSRAQVRVFNSNDSSSVHGSLYLSNSNQDFTQNYLRNLFSDIETIHIFPKPKNAYSDSDDDDDDDNEDDFDDFVAPEIKIIEDKTQFLVSKHIQGIPQLGYENAFNSGIKVKNNLKEKARALSAKGKRKVEDTSKYQQAKEEDKPKSNVKSTDEDYIQAVIKGSFPEQQINLENGPESSSEVSNQPLLPIIFLLL